MFTSDVIRVIEYFQTEDLKIDSNIMSRCSRIDVPLSNFYQAQAIASLFKLCNKSKDYDFLFKKQEFDSEQGVVAIFAQPSEAGKKVDAVFMKALKKAVINFSIDLSHSWLPYDNGDDFGIIEFRQEGAAIFKKSEDGTYSIYRNLNRLTGGKVNIESMDEKDLIAGSKKEVEEFLDYLKTVGKEFQDKLAKVSKVAKKAVEEVSRECVICLDREKKVAMLPCGHRAYCVECINELSQCAICRQPKQGHVQVFDS